MKAEELQALRGKNRSNSLAIIDINEHAALMERQRQIVAEKNENQSQNSRQPHDATLQNPMQNLAE